MKIISISNKKFQNLKKLNLSREIFNTEGIIYEFNYRGNEKILKTLYTLEMLDSNVQYLPSNFYIPDYLTSVNSKICGFTVPKVSGINLSTILRSKSMDWKEQIYYLKQVGELLQRLHNIRKYTPLKDIYLNDLHDSNFIVDTDKKELKVIDLDSCKICNNKPFASRFLTPMSLLNNSKKYKINNDESSPGFIIADGNSDLYCYCIIILNYLFGSSVNNMSLSDFYEYLNYLESIGIDKNLIEIFNRIVTSADNKNPVNYLDSIKSEQVYRAKEVVYSKVKNR